MYDELSLGFVMKFVLEYFNARYSETVTESSRPIEFTADTFSPILNDGQFVGWVMAEELFLEDHGFEEYDGDDFEMDTVDVIEANSEQQSVHLRIAFELELDDEPTEEDDLKELLNAVSAACMILFWSEPDENARSHPNHGKGLFWFNGEINRAWVNGALIHSRG